MRSSVRIEALFATGIHDPAPTSPGPPFQSATEPITMAITPDGATLYVANSTDSTVTPVAVHVRTLPAPQSASATLPLVLQYTPTVALPMWPTSMAVRSRRSPVATNTAGTTRSLSAVSR